MPTEDKNMQFIELNLGKTLKIWLLKMHFLSAVINYEVILQS